MYCVMQIVVSFVATLKFVKIRITTFEAVFLLLVCQQ